MDGVVPVGVLLAIIATPGVVVSSGDRGGGWKSGDKQDEESVRMRRRMITLINDMVKALVFWKLMTT